MSKPVVMVIDNDEDVRAFFEELLDAEGYQPCILSVHDASMTTFEQLQPEIVVIEALGETFDASIAFLQRISQRTVSTTLPVLVSSTNSLLATQFADFCQYTDCQTMEKPFDIDVFLKCVAGAIPAKAH